MVGLGFPPRGRPCVASQCSFQKDHPMAKTAVAHQTKPVVAEIRKDSERGSRKTQFLRASGKTPGIVYGLGQKPVAIALSTPETVSVLRSGSHILELTIE